ncbi:MAG: efflux RND transporter periplasmic adaptor subunit [bacterium]|nr:efflux RND transporter periplasmic adaptor subunit [bacterium]
MLKKRAFWIVLAVVLAVASGGLWYSGLVPGLPGPNAVAVADTTAADSTLAATEDDGDDDKPEVLPVPVRLALVEGRGISAYYRAASVIEADRLVDLVSRAQGRVSKVAVEEGDWVQEGQLLAELENDREIIQLRKAELTLSDKTRLLERNRSMLAEELISHQEFDDVESSWKLAEAERDLARIAVEETRVRAPFTGRITDRKVVPGQQVAALVPVFELGDFSPLRIRVHLPENIARKVDAGQRVLVTPEALEETCEAVVERVSPVVDPATSTVRLTLLLDEQEGARVGGFAKVRITTDSHHDALAIPKLALVEEGALRSVFVAEADTVRKIEIRTGLYDETHVEVLEGLATGEHVVTMGQGGLRTGSLIRPLNADEVGYVPPTDDMDPAAAGDVTVARSE